MTFLGRQDAALVFILRPRERDLLAMLLDRYPVLEPSDHRVARPEHLSAFSTEQELLTESMAEQQGGNRRQIETFIRERLATAEPLNDGDGPLDGIRLAVTDAEIGWLLEILNNVRVGCWVKMGRPDENQIRSLRSSVTYPEDYSTMEIAGIIQSLLLQALET